MSTNLAVNADSKTGTAHGCCTPKEDQLPQKMSVLPKRVLPIIFLPGIMGSNLRMSAQRQAMLKKSNNIAWRPDRTKEALALVNANAARRQLQLDPLNTEVDIYDPQTNPTGNRDETAWDRHDLGSIRVKLMTGVDSLLLIDDPISSTNPNPKTKEMKARERGWGEIYFGSYRSILEMCEEAFNNPWSMHFTKVFDRDPAELGAVSIPALKKLTEKEHKTAVAGCWFPVHAMGYNWLQSNADSARTLSKRIRALMAKYCEHYQCEKIILMTHSMGGLVARALIHPDIGGLNAEVLGIVHGVMPATGAPAAYKRMRAGFEEAYGGLDPAPKVLGNFGSEVTAVLGNAQGGLELLPNKVYGNGWLEIKQNDSLLFSLPKNGDPYSEIYTLRGKWFGLLREDWLNPAALPGCGFAKTSDMLRGAEEFHNAIRDTYHQVSYAHYGADPKRSSWERVVWNLDKKKNAGNWQSLLIATDSGHGQFELNKTGEVTAVDVGRLIDGIAAASGETPGTLGVSLGKSSGLGDQTVPLRSAANQLQSGKFQGIFQQQGYEHQASYSDPLAVFSTLYSLSRIIKTMKWSTFA